MSRRCRSVVLAPLAPVALALSMLMSGCTGSADDLSLSWSDEFGGPAGARPDPERWGYQTGGKGWGNSELECYTDAPGNVSTDGKGHLVIAAIRQPGHVCSDGAVNDYTSARITTQRKFTAKYGRLEIRAKVPAAVGTWSAFWALGRDHDTVGWPRSGEIDVMEQVGREPRTVLGTVHGPRADGSRWYLTGKHETRRPLAAAFHVYAVEWSPTRLIWSVDGREYATVSRTKARKHGRWVFQKPFYLLVNLAIGGNLGGPVDPAAAWPQTYVVDWVRVWS